MSTSYAAHAQACLEGDDGGADFADDDGGAAVCEDPDSGAPIDNVDASVPDAGMNDAGMDAGADAGTDASVDIGHACSCESAEGNDQGRIHVCTGSESADICSHFACDTGTVRNRPCPLTEVKLCCDLRARDQYSQLYEDCTHPNCETGFRAQCDDFGGFITEGACDIELHDEYAENAGDSGGGFCSVSRLESGGTRHRHASAWLVLAGVALGLGWRRRAALGVR